MKITFKDDLPGHCGKMTKDADIEPVEIELTQQDLNGIAEMPEGCSSIIFFPDGWTRQQADEYLESTKVNTCGLPPHRLQDAILAIDAGSLDAARAILREGIPENLLLPADYKERLEPKPEAGQEPVT